MYKYRQNYPSTSVHFQCLQPIQPTMAFKFLVFAAFVAVARAGAIGYAAAPTYAHGPQVAYAHGPQVAYAHGPQVAYAHGPQVAYAHGPQVAYAHAPVAKVAYAGPIAKVVAEPDHFDPHPQYSFAYDVQDGLTGDSKSQHESRDGDVVHGSYSLVDADGHKRTVEYTADDHNGFNAVVHREPLGHHVVKAVAPVAKVAYAAPVASYAAAPVAYAQPAYVAHAQPAHGYYHH